MAPMATTMQRRGIPDPGVALTMHTPEGDQRIILHPGETLMVEFPGAGRGLITGAPQRKGRAATPKRKHPSGLSYRQRQARGRKARGGRAKAANVKVEIRGDTAAATVAIRRVQDEIERHAGSLRA